MLRKLLCAFFGFYQLQDRYWNWCRKWACKRCLISNKNVTVAFATIFGRENLWLILETWRCFLFMYGLNEFAVAHMLMYAHHTRMNETSLANVTRVECAQQTERMNEEKKREKEKYERKNDCKQLAQSLCVTHHITLEHLVQCTTYTHSLDCNGIKSFVIYGSINGK